MSGIQTAQVVNATIYLERKTLLGRAAEVKLPEHHGGHERTQRPGHGGQVRTARGF